MVGVFWKRGRIKEIKGINRNFVYNVIKNIVVVLLHKNVVPSIG
jgi:hypothetical protein